MKPLHLLTIQTLILLIAKPNVYPADFSVKTASQKAEKKERSVDQVAIESQEIGINRIKKLLKKHKHSSKKSILLERLAEAYQTKASIEFRIAHAKAHYSGKKVHLKNYKQTLNNAVSIYSQLIREFPSYPAIDRAYFFRGKAYEELDKKKKAKSDYIHLVNEFPYTSESTSAYMSLANFAIDDNHHREAVKYLHKVEERPETPHYSFALHKLAWSYYNLKEIKKSVDYIEQHIGFYRLKKKEQQVLTSADEAILENSFNDLTLFYLDGFEQKVKNFDLESTAKYFSDISDAKNLGKMNLRFSKLLRAHGHDSSLISWKNLIFEREPKLPETLEIILTVYEHERDKKRFKNLTSLTKDIVSFYNKNKKEIEENKEILKVYKKSQNTLISSANELQKLIIKNKKATKVKELSNVLAAVYDSFTKIVLPTDPRVPGVHYNLAETLFEIKDFKNSTTHYRWIVDSWKKDWENQKQLNLHIASLKSISSRYEVLNTLKFIPKAIKPKSIRDDENGDLKEEIKEWVSWIDFHQKRFLSTKRLRKKVSQQNQEEFRNFQFEAFRTLYSQNQITNAIKRLREFADNYPKNKFAIPSAGLVVDTYVTSKDWPTVHETSTHFLNENSWKKTKFHKKLFSIAADSFYKMIESYYAAGEKEKVLEESKTFLENYSADPRSQDALYMAAKAALDLEEVNTGEKYLSQLIKKFPKSKNTTEALLARAQMKERRYELNDSANDLLTYLEKSPELSKSKKEELHEKIVRLFWIDNKLTNSKLFDKSKTYCKGKMSDDCKKYRLTIDFITLKENKTSKKEFKKLFKNAQKDQKEFRPYWAAQAIKGMDHYGFRDRLLLVRILMGRWSELDPKIQIVMMPELSKLIPLIFEKNRKILNRINPLKGTESSITRRVGILKEVEKTATKAMRLPWAQVKVELVKELALYYQDFSKTLSQLPAPKGLPEAELADYQSTLMKLAFPFEEKSLDLLNNALDLAGKNLVNPQIALKIATALFENSPSLAQSYQINRSEVPHFDFNWKTLVQLDDNQNWKDWKKSSYQKLKADYLDSNEKNEEILRDYLASLWIEALRNQQWQKSAYLISQMKIRKTMTENTLTLAQAWTMKTLGAHAESMANLFQLKEALTPEKNADIQLILLSNALLNYSKSNVKEWTEAFLDLASSNTPLEYIDEEEEAFLISYGALWSGLEIPEERWIALLDEAEDSSSRFHQQWASTELKKIKKPVKKEKTSPKLRAAK